ncbi:histidine phosphatase family protein [Oxalobacter sp. OttesenSCG-928-P03]|nr:histidine phosphatase family protein [Oxalobacter sp. OttesenSCG-928-P03]
MQLFLWRHADALTGSPDRERPLSEKGKKEAALTADWLGTALPADARILVSPALRTRQTANSLGRSYDIHAGLAIGSKPEDILAAAGWGKAGKTVLLVGHQPMLGYLASLLLCGKKQEWHIERSNVWWFEGDGKDYRNTILKAVISPSILGHDSLASLPGKKS